MEVFVLVNAVNVPRLVHYSMSFYDNLYGLVCEEYDRRSRVVRSRLVIVRLDDDILLSNTIHRNHSFIVLFFSSLLPPVCIYFVVLRNPGSFANFVWYNIPTVLLLVQLVCMSSNDRLSVGCPSQSHHTPRFLLLVWWDADPAAAAAADAAAE